MDRLLAKCPGFAGSWREHLDWWDGDARGIYNDAGAFAHWVVRSYEAGDRAAVSAAFSEIEILLADGDAATREVASTGLLEDIQTIASNRPFGHEVFAQWLGPLSSTAWRQIEQTWEGKASLMDVLRDENRRRDEPPSGLDCDPTSRSSGRVTGGSPLSGQSDALGEPMSPSFGDNVRIRVTKETEDAGVAGLEGQVYGETTPSVTGVQVIGSASDDYALNVHFEGRGEALWFAPELVELLDHAPGTEIRLTGVDKKWTRTEDGGWHEESLAPDQKPWWKFW